MDHFERFSGKLYRMRCRSYVLMTSIYLVLVIADVLYESQHVDCRLKPMFSWVKDNICKNGYAIRCNKTGMSNIPKSFPRFPNFSTPCLLDLSQNKLSRIMEFSFVQVKEIKILFLYDNNISRIDSKAFANLTALQQLNLSINDLHKPDSFGEGVFDSLVNLRYINLKNNFISTYNWLQDLLRPLINLEALYLSGCFDCTFGKGFEMFYNLKNVSLSGAGFRNCNISIVSENMFKYLPQVQHLFLCHCRITTVEKSAFRHLKNIKTLDISYNDDLRFEGMKHVLEGLANSSVESINFNHIHEQYEMGLELKYDHMEPIQYLPNLKELLLDLNKIEIIEGSVFELIPKSTKFVAISGNRLTKGKYVANLTNLKHIEELDLSYQHIEYDPFYNDHFELPPQGASFISDPHIIRSTRATGWDTAYLSSTAPSSSCPDCLRYCHANDTTCICLPPKLKNLTFSKSYIYIQVGRFRVCPPVSLEQLDVSSNLIHTWTGPIVGLGNLKMLNLRKNFCSKMSPDFFDNLSNLTYLNLSYNLLGQTLKPTGVGDGEHFKKLNVLETLDLSDNRITTLSRDIFKNLLSLKHLDLSRNLLSSWNSTLKSTCLEVLDLSFNKFVTIPESLRQFLEEISSPSTTKSCKRKGNVSLVLSGNPVQCNCDTRQFIRWMMDSPVDIKFSSIDKCHLPDGNQIQLGKQRTSELLQRLDKQCFPYISIAISVCTIVISPSLCVVLYLHRWKLRHWYYSKKKRHRHMGYDRLFERDAFISYASTEGGFIKRFLVPALEGERGLKVWVADRDSVPGVSVAENLAHAINFSKKTVLLLSRCYFKENWCDYEMNLARVESVETKRNLFIIVLFEDISPIEMPLDILRLLQAEEHIEYPTNPQEYNAFWDSLCASIRSV